MCCCWSCSFSTSPRGTEQNCKGDEWYIAHACTQVHKRLHSPLPPRAHADPRHGRRRTSRADLWVAIGDSLHEFVKHVEVLFTIKPTLTHAHVSEHKRGERNTRDRGFEGGKGERGAKGAEGEQRERRRGTGIEGEKRFLSEGEGLDAGGTDACDAKCSNGALRVRQQRLVICTHVDDHWHHSVRRDAARGHIQGEFSNRDAHAMRAKITQAEDARAVGDAHDVDLPCLATMAI